MKLRRCLAVLLVGLPGVVLSGTSAQAVEYRLLVANVFEASLTSFVGTQELYNGASGPGLVQLEKVLDVGDMDRGAMPAQRSLMSVPDRIARAWGGVAIHSDILHGGIDIGRWDEVRWQGKPGERSIWIVRSYGNQRPQAIVRMTLEGSGPVRLYQPYARSGRDRVAVMQMPQPLIGHYESHGNVWDKWVAQGLDLGQGIAAVVGLNNNALFADLVYLIVNQNDQPTTYKAVIAWSDREIDREGRDAVIRKGFHRH